MTGGIIARVETGSRADKAGIRAGDKVIAVNGEPVHDVIDYQFACLDDCLRVTLQRQGRLAVVRIGSGPGPIGITFMSATFGGVRRCANRCVFCFVDQMPAGVRPSLAVKDDDFRLSFLHGNFITLTNLGPAALERIARQRLSPLYVSVHAVDPALRARLLRPRGSDPGLANLEVLLAAGIEVHAQIVLCPGLNDGRYLDETIAYLGARTNVKSVGVVPVGLTSHRRGLSDLRSYDSEGAAAVLEQISDWQKRFLADSGGRKVFAADEFYLRAGWSIPGERHYEEFPQLENGIGMSALFLAEINRALKGRRRRMSVWTPATALTGRIAEPVLREALSLVDKNSGNRIKVAAVDNTFLGPEVSVAGLMAGVDVRRQAANVPGRLLLPDVCLNENLLFVDGLSFAEVNTACDGRIKVVPTRGDAFVRFLRQAA